MAVDTEHKANLFPHNAPKPLFVFLGTEYCLNRTSCKLADIISSQAKVLGNESIFVGKAAPKDPCIVSLLLLVSYPWLHWAILA